MAHNPDHADISGGSDATASDPPPNWRLRGYWPVGRALENQLGSLLVSGKREKFIRSIGRLLSHHRLSRVFFSSPNGLTLVLLMVHQWREFGHEQLHALLNDMARETTPFGNTGISFYRLRLDELSGRAVDPGEKQRRHADFEREQKKRVALLRTPSTESYREAFRQLFSSEDPDPGIGTT
ncbi:MAG TPA: hypothetical protein VK689_09095 [Armatimonadota bacterium]|nr:hypothetical protein [Armatimonadota bacterium]